MYVIFSKVKSITNFTHVTGTFYFTIIDTFTTTNTIFTTKHIYFTKINTGPITRPKCDLVYNVKFIYFSLIIL
jgi:hypothetical protein